MHSDNFSSNGFDKPSESKDEDRSESIVQYLQDFGLSLKEAKIFFILSKLGSASASEVGNNAKLSRLQVYRSLKNLINKGLIEVSLEQPRRYTPLEIDQAINLLEHEAELKIQDLEKKRPLLLGEWAKAADLQLHQNNSAFRIVQGKKNVFKFNLSLCEAAKKEIVTIIKGNDLPRWVFEGGDEVLKKVARKHILLKSLSEVNDGNANASKVFLKFSGFRHTSHPYLVPLTIVDGSEVLIGLSGPSGLSENAIWTNHGEVVDMLKGFFDILWELAQDGDSKLRQLGYAIPSKSKDFSTG